MPDDATISAARNRLRAIRGELEKLQAEAQELEQALAVLGRYGFLDASATVPPAAPVGISSVQLPSQVSAGIIPPVPEQMPQAEFVPIAIKLLLEHGKPMTRSKLLRRFQEIGHPVPGEHPTKNIGTKLWRASDVIINIPGAGYWVKDTPCPAVGYDPDKLTRESQPELV